MYSGGRMYWCSAMPHAYDAWHLILAFTRLMTMVARFGTRGYTNVL